jgi:hypothetical protein
MGGPEGFPDALRQAFMRERLLQNSHRSSADAVLFDGVVRVPLFGKRRSPKGSADSAADFLQNVERVGDQDGSDRGTQNDDQFRGLHQDLQIAVFHQVPGNHGPKDHHDSYNRKHRFPNLRIAPAMSGENGHAIPALFNALLK